MLPGIPHSLQILVLVVISLYGVLLLVDAIKAEYKKQMDETISALEKIPFSYLVLSNISLWGSDGTYCYLPHINPCQVEFADLRKGDFTQTRYLLIGNNYIEQYDHDFEAIGKFKPALHSAILSVEVNRNGAVITKPLPINGKVINDVRMTTALLRAPVGKYRDLKEKLDAIG